MTTDTKMKYTNHCAVDSSPQDRTCRQTLEKGKTPIIGLAMRTTQEDGKEEEDGKEKKARCSLRSSP